MQTQTLSIVATVSTCQRPPGSLPIFIFKSVGCAAVLVKDNTTPNQRVRDTCSWYTGHHALATLPQPSSSQSVSDTQVLIVKFYPSTNWMPTPAWLHKGEGRNYKSTERSCLQDSDSLATTRVKALFSVTSRSFMCLKDWICFICWRFCRNQRNRSENKKTTCILCLEELEMSRIERKLRRDSPV